MEESNKIRNDYGDSTDASKSKKTSMASGSVASSHDREARASLTKNGEADVVSPNWESIAKYKAAELENYIKRQKDAVGNAFNDGRLSVVMGILPIMDIAAEALKSMKDENDRKGVEMLLKKFEANMYSIGLEEIACKAGDKFDPYVHNCVSKEHEDNIVREIWQKGYRLGGKVPGDSQGSYKFAGRVIRPVAVKI